MTKTQQELIQEIEAYAAREQDIRHRLDASTDYRERAELQLMLRLLTVLQMGLSNELMETTYIEHAGQPLRTSLDAQRPA